VEEPVNPDLPQIMLLNWSRRNSGGGGNAVKLFIIYA